MKRSLERKSMELNKITKSSHKLEVLNSLGIYEVRDLLTYYPTRYTLTIDTPFDSFVKDEKVCFEAELITPFKTSYYAHNRSVTRFNVVYEEEELQVTIFNRAYLKAPPGVDRIFIAGKYEGNHKVVASSVNFKPIDEQLGIFPVYPLKDGIKQNELSRYIKKALELYQGKIVNVIPDRYLEKYRLVAKEEAIHQIHFPDSKEKLEQALRHLKYEEFLKFHVSMQLSRKNDIEYVIKEDRYVNHELINEFISKLPYELSHDQSKAINDIIADIESNRVMYRLLQGDVGCGKTVVAQIAMLACVSAGYQAAIMAPTEILAKQHYEGFRKFFPDLKISLLCGSLKAKERKEILEEIASGESKMIIGTHALFQEDVNYHSLGLVVTDEQHRFGVEQRRRLKEKGDAVDLLLMSATPIPRTLAISLYGDLDVSTIKELPKGRKMTITKYIPHNSMSYILEEIIDYLQTGTQIYVITPLIEESEVLNVKHAQGIYENLSRILQNFGKVGLLHGKMSAEEKEKIMDDFVHNRIQVLVSTTVIEVGVNVGNANVMVIYDAERFGLSQLHQLRGRVGRSNQQGICYLLSNSKDSNAIKRLKLMEKCSDGFEIATEDLKMRGAGDILGKRQSGVSGFVLGDIVLDSAILEVARKDAIEIVNCFNDDEYRMLKLWYELHSKTQYMD